MSLIPSKIIDKLTERLFRRKKDASDEICVNAVDKMVSPSYLTTASVGNPQPAKTEYPEDVYVQTIAIKWPLKGSAMVDADFAETARPSDGAYIHRGMRRFGDDRIETEAQVKELAEETDVLYIPPYKKIPVLKPVLQEENISGEDLFTSRGLYIGFRPREYAAAELLKDDKPVKTTEKFASTFMETEKAEQPETPEIPQTPEIQEKAEEPSIMSGGLESLFEPEELPEHKDMYDVAESDVDRKTLISAFVRKFKN